MHRGKPWGRRPTAAPDAEVTGNDAALARAVASRPHARLRFRPDASSDLALAIGVTTAHDGTLELPLDALVTDAGDTAVNLIVAGVPPDRMRWWHRPKRVRVRVDGRDVFDGPATTVVVANGEFLRAIDLSPRGHPNDGRAEVQVYGLTRSERGQLRRRLGAGSHLPNPRITTPGGRTVEIEWSRPVHLELDAEPRPPARSLRADVVHDAYRLIV
jgi:hypothetical protein